MVTKTIKSGGKQTGGSPQRSERHLRQAHGALGSWTDQPGFQRRGLCVNEAKGLGSGVLIWAGLNDLADISGSLGPAFLILPKTS